MFLSFIKNKILKIANNETELTNFFDLHKTNILSQIADYLKTIQPIKTNYFLFTPTASHNDSLAYLNLKISPTKTTTSTISPEELISYFQENSIPVDSHKIHAILSANDLLLKFGISFYTIELPTSEEQAQNLLNSIDTIYNNIQNINDEFSLYLNQSASVNIDIEFYFDFDTLKFSVVSDFFNEELDKEVQNSIDHTLYQDFATPIYEMISDKRFNEPSDFFKFFFNPRNKKYLTINDNVKSSIRDILTVLTSKISKSLSLPPQTLNAEIIDASQMNLLESI